MRNDDDLLFLDTLTNIYLQLFKITKLSLLKLFFSFKLASEPHNPAILAKIPLKSFTTQARLVLLLPVLSAIAILAECLTNKKKPEVTITRSKNGILTSKIEAVV